MKVSIDCAPSYAIAYCHLDYNETLHVESDGMALMSDGVVLSTGSGGNVIKGLARKALGGESFFMGAYTAQVQGAWVAVTPQYPGDIKELDLGESGEMVAEAGSLLAYGDGVDVGVRVSGMKQAIATRSLTLLSLKGSGKALLSSYGGLREFDVASGQSLIVDTGHLVAYTAGMDTDMGLLGGAVAATTSGEDLVIRLHGPGRVLVQTRAPKQFATWMRKILE